MIPFHADAEVLNAPGGDAQKIESLYLRTLSRKPTAVEVDKWTSFLSKPRDAIITDSVLDAPKTPMTRQEMRKLMLAKPGQADSGRTYQLGRFAAHPPVLLLPCRSCEFLSLKNALRYDERNHQAQKENRNHQSKS